ncbi:MAG: hypothetical protein KKA84_06755 [Bacteroidetes bacterium]|nr:hypothetical protein [Bacteroidota bacterium]
MNQFAVLLDTTSIQKYVFGSNKLKENLGASFLVDQVFKKFVDDVTIKPIMESNNEYKGYIGGGNALLFFSNKEESEDFINEWTRNLLVKAPGITTAVAYKEFDESKFKIEKDELFRLLRENKAREIPQTVIARHGFTAECSNTGYSMENWNDLEVEDKKNYVSAVTFAKVRASKNAKAKINTDYEIILKGKYEFTDDLEKLGQSEGEDSHIAVVHIDGNGMGERFRELETLDDTKQLSKNVESAVKNSFDYLLEQILTDLNNDGKCKEYNLVQENQTTILPLRPIILGGDDITFVCNGKFGIYFAKIFLEKFQSIQVHGDLLLSACAGVAITKTKYPFYRGYELAEQLCTNAKMRRLKLEGDNGGSWLDFHIAYGGFSGTLEELRKRQFILSQRSLLLRPYKLDENELISFDNLISSTKKLIAKNPETGKPSWPKNKLMEMREKLTLGESEIKTFINDCRFRERIIPDFAGKPFNEDLFSDFNGIRATPFFDMIEILEFYPEFELIN